MASDNTNNTVAQSTRFTLLVENVFAIDENESIAVVGNLHGKIKTGDTFYIIHPKFPAGIKASVDTLVVNGETPDAAEECRVAVKFTEVTDPAEIPKYSVISNIAPQVRLDPKLPLENPFLVGLSTEYTRLVTENEFTYTFMTALLTTRYLTPAEMELEAPGPDGRSVIKDKKINFKLLRHPNDESKLAFPVFTDMAALRMWSSLFEQSPSGEKITTVVLPFERCAQIAKSNGGMVINPFGPAAVYVSNANIDNTLELSAKVLERQKTMQALQDQQNNKK